MRAACKERANAAADEREVNPWLATGAVAVGGAFGSALRYLVGMWFLQRLGPGFPWGTFTINVTGAFALGVVLELADSRVGLNPYARVLLGTGVLGGFTTFSTFAWETLWLSRDGANMTSLWYVGGSVVAGVAAAFAGAVAARAVFA
ncbi:MAG: hypothetical protein NVS3B7_00720 [Candidatus Elarobacter sp.]